MNNAGAELPFKEESRKLFLEFVAEPKDSPRWTNSGGIYTSKVFANGRLKIILLDLRFGRSAESAMSEEQWIWLENELASKESLKLVGSSVQVLPVDRPIQERAGQPWSSHERLMKLFSKSSGVVLLSGDVHCSNFLQSRCGLSYDVTEFTSSGMTHSWLTVPMQRWLEPLLHSVGRSRFELNRTFTGLSFGMLTINWTTESVLLEVVEPSGQRPMTMTLNFADLKPKFEPSYEGCPQGGGGGVRGDLHFAELLMFATALAGCFGALLGIYQYCKCRRARLKADKSKKIF